MLTVCLLKIAEDQQTLISIYVSQLDLCYYTRVVINVIMRVRFDIKSMKDPGPEKHLSSWIFTCNYF